MQIKGIMWHSTGANNPNLRRYVQPTNDTSLLQKIGKNTYNNDWNRASCEVCVHAFIGKLADGSIATVQTLPFNYKSWGCGQGRNGSCNNGYI